jgi:outer membrane protein OmpA-like peptidoglycan-associated protein/tetratricopeptide (TPR) repeat protein
MFERYRKIQEDSRLEATEDRGQHICLLSPSISFYLLMAVIGGCLLSSCGADNHLKKGDQYYAIGEYYDAAAEYKKAYSRTKTTEKEKRGVRAWKMAECYRRINYTAKAIGAYQNAIRYNYPDTIAWLYLAQLQHKQGDYKTAIKSYNTYLEMVPKAPLAVNGVQGCMQAPIWKKRPTLYSIKKEPILNSRRADFSPMLLGDDADQLYITTSRPQATGNEVSGITGTKSTDIFLSKKDDKGKWGSPEMVEGDLNSEYEEGACCFSPDGKTMYLTRCTYDADYPRYAEIYTSQRSDAAWSKPQLLQITKDTLSSYAHPAVSPDGRWLYFTSDMPGGYGGKDIWRIALTEGGGLGGVENVGEPINTEGDEMFPCFRPNGELYFSSNGHVGMGGLDIFKAKRDTTTGNWQIENLKVPMNSCGDDFGMTFEGLHNRGFFCTNRGDARGWDHIMSFECPEVIHTVKGWVYEKDGYELPEGLVYMVGNDGTYQKLSVRGDGSFVQEVTPNVDYVFLGTCTGYLNHKEELHVDTSSVSQEFVLQFPLASINNPVLIRNVFYEFDSAALTESSTLALDSLVDLLNENPNVTIELSSHCDFRGKDEYNEKLSQRRAESVVNYLIEHGIEAERLTPVGYGEKRPKVVTRKIAEQNDFLHEGDTLTEAFILRLEDVEKQEICHAYNRRTEFKVLRTTYRLFDNPKTAEEIEKTVNEAEKPTEEIEQPTEKAEKPKEETKPREEI